jgi:predicted dehydrogenase
MIRIGILGAARVAPMAVVEPAARRDDVKLVAVAARRPGRAAAFAAEHGIATAYDSYEALIADPGIDVVYNALPPHLHAELSVMALEAGKHVLCEKPFAMDAEEARRMVEAGRRAGRRIIEAFHDRYHPVFLYLEDLVASGRLGRLTSLRAAFNHAIPHVEGDFRRLARMGGGVLREFGCYPVHWCRSLVREEPEVVSAEVTLTEGGVDEDATALLRFPSGVLAEIEARMSPGWDMHARLRIEGDRGSVEATNNLLPHRGHSIVGTPSWSASTAGCASTRWPGGRPSTTSWPCSWRLSRAGVPSPRKEPTRSATWRRSTRSTPPPASAAGDPSATSARTGREGTRAATPGSGTGPPASALRTSSVPGLLETVEVTVALTASRHRSGRAHPGVGRVKVSPPGNPRVRPRRFSPGIPGRDPPPA